MVVGGLIVFVGGEKIGEGSWVGVWFLGEVVGDVGIVGVGGENVWGVFGVDGMCEEVWGGEIFGWMYGSVRLDGWWCGGKGGDWWVVGECVEVSWVCGELMEM